MDAKLAHAMSTAVEVLHGEIYSAPEMKDVYSSAGLKGGWMGYFAFRAAPLGPVGPEVVTAVFYNFHERHVRRSIPDAWTFAPPARVLEARYELAGIALGRALKRADPEAVAEAATIVEGAARAADPAGRTLFAANASVSWPDDPILRLWHATTLLREFRGDGHNAVLAYEGVDGCECHHLAAAAGQVADMNEHREHRGYTEEEWGAARARLQERSLLDSGGGFTDAGRALKERIEDRTDALAAPPYAAIGEEACLRFVDLAPEIAPGLAHLFDRGR